MMLIFCFRFKTPNCPVTCLTLSGQARHFFSFMVVDYPADALAFSYLKEMLVWLLKAVVLPLCSGLLQCSLSCRFLNCVPCLVVFGPLPGALAAWREDALVQWRGWKQNSAREQLTAAQLFRGNT